ncbi:hypothetical protein [Sphingopyxis sp. EG6]|uniref:hypothetical protein n=1 Tax=Sphingopyxis sp. EG6 TaxID=1874061 RepID=UPI000DC6408D|nr:hypothetical protein [Sphingopyxis sp. EG6]BBB10617.1 hypothetical protein SPYCW_3633 [Sphingopyxis sp. EG6]
MSRHAVTVRSSTRTDDNAVIGYDPPMRTYFLQAFEDIESDEPGLWLGTRFDEYPDLPSLVAAVEAGGYALDNLADEDVADMAREAAQPARCSFAERTGQPMR